MFDLVLYELLEYGPKEVLKLGDFPLPTPQDNQLLVQVRAAALNPIDVKRRQGPIFPSDFPVIPGCDMAGVVIAQGRSVAKFHIGDEVYGNIQDFNGGGQPKQLGTLAEFIVVEESMVAKKPKNLSFEEAASLPLVVQTAVEGFVTAGFKEGQTIFVVGGAGGVGSLVVQLAKHLYGASHVVATTSTPKLEFVKSLGADKVVDYTKTPYEEIEEKYDLLYDTIGDCKKSFVLAKENAPIIDITWPTSHPKALYSTLTASGEILERLRPHLETGKLKAVIDPSGPYNFADVIEAFRYLETGRARGKMYSQAMDNLSIILTFIASWLLLISIPFLYLLLKIYSGKSIRSPSYPPVNGTVFGQLFYFNRLYDQQTQQAKEHKTFRLLAPDQSEIYTTDPRNIEHALKTRFDKYSKGKYTQEILTDLFGEGIFAVDGNKWRQQRKLSSFEFSTRVLRDFSSAVFRTNAAKLVRVISDIAIAGQVFDMQDILMRCTLDSIFKVGFGVELNCLTGSSREATEFMKAFDDSNALIYWRFVDPFWKLKRYFNVGSEASLRKNIKVIDDFVAKLISTKRKLLADQSCYNDKEDILSRFLVERRKDPEKMNDQYLRDIILNFMIAGKDTSANTLSWFFYMLCKNPLIQEKVAQEVRDVTGDQDDEADIEHFVAKITDSTLDQMHYLHATLSETLRLYPAVPVDGRCAEVDDILPDGYRLKKGDGVNYLAYAMGRMPYIWGEDAEDFRPERWLKDGVFQPESPFKFIAFHAGPRICLGKDFAYRQMKIVSMALLRFLRFKLPDDTKDVTYKTMFTLHISGGLYLCATARSPSYPPVDGTVFGQLFYFNRLYDQQTDQAKEHKTFRLLAPDQSEIYTTDVRNIEHVLKTRFDKYNKGKYNQDIVTDLFGEGIFAVDGDKWRQQRKLSSFEFSTRVLRDFSSAVFRTNAAKLVRLISDTAIADQVFDMQDILMRCTLDSIFKVGFGVELNCLIGSSREGTEFMKAFDDSNALVYWRYVDPFWKLKRYFNVGYEASLRKNIKNDKEDILSRFLVESKKDPEKMNDRYLRDIILNFMIAGKDTSANTLSWFFYMLCKNPLIQEKIAQEVRDVTGDQDDEANIDDFIAKITESTLDQMHYLHATLSETLRLYPAVPVDGRSAEADDVLPDGFRLKKGDGVYYMAYAMGRMPYIWGEDAEDFRPERWLKDGIFQPESPFKFIAFHAGPRTCLGKDFAYRQMKIVSMALLRFLRFKLADGTKNVTYKTMFTLHISGGLHLCATPR
ncbi:hypothetical protein Tsubulata_021524 [Turnera subulata]|uniref:Enoyl reductase (ER) domain-containing protein n=1 Tax=Turnera subulata TaxID=218843 RepID=A0A9Q0GBC6_9ROSI|nr:hypothetical protein Tsubulata_021524 [Turnera subulata]